MAKIKRIIIEEIDLVKLYKKAGIVSLKQLAHLAEVSYENLIRINQGKHYMTEETWEKIKKVI